MADISFTSDDELKDDGRHKYPAILRRVAEVQSTNPDTKGKWAFITEFASPGTARDCATRLRKVYPGFEFISRKGEGTTAVYARTIQGDDDE